uniref:Uncharacterized protein n=1 Tax=Hucho hucho TaxID=62062 RepID=A0A4W5MDC0_9TELE
MKLETLISLTSFKHQLCCCGCTCLDFICVALLRTSSIMVWCPLRFSSSPVELPFYDFPKLGETIDPNMSLKINQRKNEALQANIWRSALVSGWVAAIPISGLSFSLDNESLQSLAGRTNVPVEELKAVLKSPLNKKISQDTFIKILTKAAGSTLMVAEYFLSTIPVLGSMAAGGMSYGTTYYILKSCLNELTEDAQNVLMKALKVYE